MHLMPVPRRKSKRRIDQAQRFFRNLTGDGTATGVRPFPKGAEGDPRVALAKARQSAKAGAAPAEPATAKPVASTTGSLVKSLTGSIGNPVKPMTGSLSRKSMSAPPAPPSEDHTVAVASIIIPAAASGDADDDLEIIESNDGTIVSEEPSHLPEFLRKKKGGK
jgi:hypothetical protein